jgi:hypothetical protein
MTDYQRGDEAPINDLAYGSTFRYGNDIYRVCVPGKGRSNAIYRSVDPNKPQLYSCTRTSKQPVEHANNALEAYELLQKLMKRLDKLEFGVPVIFDANGRKDLKGYMIGPHNDFQAKIMVIGDFGRCQYIPLDDVRINEEEYSRLKKKA